jgi:FKBP-type peptidyl-prolyl cis-trans isomerase
MHLQNLAVAALLATGLIVRSARAEDLPAADNSAPSPYKSLKERSSYAIGLDIGSKLKSDEIEIDPAALAKGIADALAGAKPAMNRKELEQTMQELDKEAERKMAARMAERDAAGKKNKVEGAEFLAANKKKEGVVTLPSGLQYKIIKQGTGATPKATDVVTTHYRGTLLNGKVFDSSYDRNEPAKFGVSQVIPGWTEALQHMKVGDKWQLFIPSELAYGDKGAGADIPPNATLIFEIELLDVGTGAAAP